MDSAINHQLILVRRPDGPPTEEVFSFTGMPVPVPSENKGKQLVRLTSE